MKKTIKITILLIVAMAVPQLAKCQMAVAAPGVEAQLTVSNSILAEETGIMATMNGVVASMEASEAQYKAMLKKASWMRDLQTARRLVTLIEKVICTTRDINIRLSFMSNSCLYSFSYDVNIVKISMAADYLTILMSDGNSMTNGERMTALNQALDKFESAHLELSKLNSLLNNEIQADLRIEQAKNQVNWAFNARRSK